MGRWLEGRRALWAALGMAVVAGGLAYGALRAQEARVRRGWDLVPVLVAAKDLAAGTTVTEALVAQREVPEQFATASVLRPESLVHVEGQPVRVPVVAGEPLLWTHFDVGQGTSRLAERVQRRGRAVTIEASVPSSVGGWVRPNDHVDVIGTFRDPASNETVAVTLLQNVIVLATGALAEPRGDTEHPGEYATVSLLVLPEEAEILALAGELGRLTLSLRNEEDPDVLEERGRATVGTLLSGERARALEERRRERIQIIRGNSTRAAAGE